MIREYSPEDRHFNCSCTACGKQFNGVFMPMCDSCGSMVDVSYDLERARLYESENPYIRFKDLLPINDPSKLPSDARFTPTIHAQKLGAELGMDWLYLKDETVFPTRSTKERMAAIALAFLNECGVTAFCTSSTGNSSTAYARAIDQFPGMELYLFTASAFQSRVQYQPNDQVHHFVMDGATFVEAFDYARVYADEHGHVTERGFFNIGRREGLKLAWLEAVEQVPRGIDWYVQAVSSAMGVYGTYKGASELFQIGRADRTPHLLCVQQESCAPMAHAWRAGAELIRPEHIVRNPRGIAEAILRGNPSRTYPHIRRIVKQSDGEILSVSETEIREAQAMVNELEGITPCASAATAVAGLIRAVGSGRVPREHTVLINLTGAGRDDPYPRHDAKWYVRQGAGWAPREA